MERLIIDIALIVVSIGFGYLTGYRACFDYLMEEVKKRRQDGGNSRRTY